MTGELLGSLRQDFTGSVGFAVTIGGSNITVTQLGRWVVSGNSQSHTLYILDNSCSIVASVAVNTSGASAGAFLYGTLSSPITLSADAIYYVTSAKTNGADQRHSYDTTSAAVITSGAYDDSGCHVSGSGGAGTPTGR